MTHLADQQRHIAPDKFAHRPGVVVEITARKALVGAVEEREVALLEHYVRDLTPLLAGRVDPSGVVRAGMDEENGARRGVLERLDVWVERETDGLRVVVRICGHRDAN